MFIVLDGRSVSPLFVLTLLFISLSRSDPVLNPVQQCCSCLNYFNFIISDQVTCRLQMKLMLYDFLFQTNWSPHCSRPTCAQSWAAGTRSAIPGTETSLPTCDSRGLCFRIIHSVTKLVPWRGKLPLLAATNTSFAVIEDRF